MGGLHETDRAKIWNQAHRVAASCANHFLIQELERRKRTVKQHSLLQLLPTQKDFSISHIAARKLTALFQGNLEEYPQGGCTYKQQSLCTVSFALYYTWQNIRGNTVQLLHPVSQHHLYCLLFVTPVLHTSKSDYFVCTFATDKTLLDSDMPEV